MGLIFARDTIYKPFVFPAPRSSYGHDMPGLSWAGQCPIYEKKHTNAKLTILFSHGNGCDLGQTREIVDMLSTQLQVNVISYDYPGYGLHQGTPTESGCYETISKVYKYLRSNSNYPIFLMGQSVGTGPTSWLAKEKEVMGVCLLSPFKSAVSVVSEYAAVASYSTHMLSETTLDVFDNYYHLQQTTHPILIIAGTNDQITPYKHACDLHAVTKSTLVTLEGAGHNDVWVRFQRQILNALLPYIRK